MKQTGRLVEVFRMEWSRQADWRNGADRPTDGSVQDGMKQTGRLVEVFRMEWSRQADWRNGADRPTDGSVQDGMKQTGRLVEVYRMEWRPVQLRKMELEAGDLDVTTSWW